MLDSKNYKKVFIIGRPNTGKSTLFNRLLGKRRSITDRTYGVTRDLIYEPYELENNKFLLVDTGGFSLTEGSLNELIASKVLEALKLADLILLVLDVNELIGEDKDIIDKVRKYTNKTVLVVNKVDTPEKGHLTFEFQKLGFKKVFFVSAEHNRGINKLRNFLHKETNMQDTVKLEDQPMLGIKIAIIGKPNSGKSTLVNYLAKKDIAIVSEEPGTTRDFIKTHFEYKNSIFEIIDTAGIRRKNRINDPIEFYSVSRALNILEEVDIVYLLITVEEGLTAQDKKIAYQAAKRGKGIILVFTKWDLVKDKKDYFLSLKNNLNFMFPVLTYVPVVKISAHKKIGIDLLLGEALKIKTQLELKHSTPELNKMLNIWVKDYYLNTKHKIRYITQTGTKPVSFVMFVTRLKDFPHSYYNYIVNNLRKIGYKNIPLLLELKET